jgi:phage tail sheath protein FI
MYWPWVQVSDTYTRQNIWLPPSGFVLAQYAYNDRVGQPWFAPAGLNRGIITRALAVEHSATKGERDTIYGGRNIINPIINYKGQGLVIWGQKTMQRKPTALDRVNVRRLLNYLKKVISASTSYFLFEGNDEYSWNKWIDMVEPKLKNVQQLRGIYDFQIKMAPTNSDIENNSMPGSIAIKPTKTAEYIPLNFMIAPYGASFEDDIA